MKKYLPLIIPAALVGMAAFIFIGGEVVKLLWNSLAPPLFGLPVLSFWQALGMLALCRILFGGFGLGGGHSHQRGRMADRMADRATDRIADRFAERWQNMSPEERERFRQRVRERCGFDPGPSENKAQ
jgi:uncharacterized membrane protein